MMEANESPAEPAADSAAVQNVVMARRRMIVDTAEKKRKGRISGNENFWTCTAGIRELHLLMQDGKGESEEADAIRDAGDEPWYGLPENETHWLGLLSSDLYTLESENAHEPTGEDDMVLARRVREAVSKALSDTTVDHLELIQTVIDMTKAITNLAFAARVRADYWLALGDEEAAKLFRGEAYRLFQLQAAESRGNNT